MPPRVVPLDADEQRRHDRRNALHTAILVFGSGALVAFIAWTVFGLTGLVWAAFFTVTGLWSASRVSPKLVLELYRARPLGEKDVPELARIVRNLAARAELPAVPALYYVPSSVMNAFAVGSRADSAIAVTDGLIRGLTLRQLTGVLAHEMSHIRNGDLRVMALSDILSRVTGVLSMAGLVFLALSVPAMLATGMRIPWLAIGLLLLAPTIGGLLQLALSRAREYDADLDAVGLTGDPEGLAAALVTLERRQGRMWEGLMLPGSRMPQPSLLRSHPRTEDRVERLLSLRSGAQPRIELPEGRAVPGPSLVPVVRPPRIHWQRMGLWY